MRNWAKGFGMAIVLGFAVSAGADDAKNDKPFSDETFVMKATQGSLHEIEAGKVAQEKATDADVKKFAERMIADHTKALEELKTAAKEANIPVSDQLDAEKQKHIERLRGYTGNEFDRMYIHHMVEDHEKAVKLFTQASKECKNEKLKAFAEKTLPTIKDHLEQAKRIHERLDKK